jgi:hypothetical protein
MESEDYFDEEEDSMDEEDEDKEEKGDEDEEEEEDEDEEEEEGPTHEMTLHWQTGGFSRGCRRDPITIPASLQVLASDFFPKHRDACAIIFARHSTLTRIQSGTFRDFFNLNSLHIPRSVEYLGSNLFCDSVGTHTPPPIKSITFERGSRLKQIDKNAFFGCSDLTSLILPASVEQIDGSLFLQCGLGKPEFERGNPHFAVDGDFLMKRTGRLSMSVDRPCRVLAFGLSISADDHVRRPVAASGDRQRGISGLFLSRPNGDSLIGRASRGRLLQLLRSDVGRFLHRALECRHFFCPGLSGLPRIARNADSAFC